MLDGKSNILNALNEHFTNIANLVDKMEFKEDTFSHLQAYLDNKLNNITFDISFITTFEVRTIIDNLKINKATGIDGIGANILKYCGEHIVLPITSIINNSISSGIFPDLLKHAYVLPIYKGSGKDDANNYRPISILPTISKIFERHLSNQIKSFFNQVSILNKHQSGFRENHSCQTALIRLIDEWLKDVDMGKCIGSVFVDLKKAFELS